MKPKITVIIPCYNEEKTIARCIRSLLSQSFKDFEIIVVNDNSTDKSKKIIDSFKSKVKAIHKKKNEGRPKGLDDALKIAKGDIVSITDSDCIIPKDWLQKIHNEFKKDKDLQALGGVYESVGKDSLSLAGNMFERIFMDSNFIPNQIPGANSSYRKKTLMKIGGYPVTKWGSDIMIGMKLHEAKSKIRMNPNIIIKTEYPNTIKKILKRKFYWGGGLGNTIEKVKFRLSFLIRPLYFIILFLSLLSSIITYFISTCSFFLSSTLFLLVLLFPIIVSLILSIRWIFKNKKFIYVKALPVMLFLPLLQEMSYFIGLMHVLIGGKLKNAWR